MRVFGGSISSGHSIIGVDNANNSTYDGGSIADDANGGYGFDAWNIIVNGSGGNFIASSSGQGFGDINVNGESWGMFGNPNGPGNGTNVQRNINRALSVGFALSACIAVAFRNGNKGMDLFTTDNFSSNVFNFNVGGDNYVFDGSNQGSWGYSQTSIFDIVAKQTTTNNIEITVTRRGTADTATTNKTGALRGFQWYCYDTDAGNDLNNLFANSLKVYRY